MRQTSSRSEAPGVRVDAIALYRLLLEEDRPLTTDEITDVIPLTSRRLRLACKHLRDHGYNVATTRSNVSRYWLEGVTSNTEHMVNRYAEDAFSALVSWYRSSRTGGGKDHRNLRGTVASGLRGIGLTILHLEDEQVTPLLQPLEAIPEIEELFPA